MPLKRFQSIDVFRAAIMFLMVFINEVSTVKNIPIWIPHATAMENSTGLVDIIFPAFIFIMGLSIPLSINNRIKQNDSDYEIYNYIFNRSAALIIMGFFQVNLEQYHPAFVLPKAVWALITTISFFFIWLNYSETFNKTLKFILISTGWLLLIMMALLFKSVNSPGFLNMHTLWWGILGIIGWSYLTCGTLYFLFKKSFYSFIILFILFGSINIALHAGFLNEQLWVIGDASSVTLTTGGIICTMFYTKTINIVKAKRVWILPTAFAVLFILFGFLLRSITSEISKINSTPAWVFINLGLSILLFEVFIYLIDKSGQKNLFKIILPAGTSTLTCYMMPYFLIYIMELFHIKYPQFLNEGMGGILRGIIISFILIWIVGQMEKKNLTLKI